MPVAAKLNTGLRLQVPPKMQRRALVVDDEPTARVLLTHRLTSADWTVDQCDDATTADQRLNEGPYDLVLLDWELGSGPSGLELCRRLRSTPLNRDAVVIMVTARDDTESLSAALEQGADDYITKPLVPAILDVRLRVAFSRAQGRHHQRLLTVHRNNLEQKLQAVVDCSPDPVFIKTLGGRYSLVNSATSGLFDLTPEDMLGQSDEQLFGSEAAADLAAVDRQVTTTGEPRTYQRTRQYGSQERTFLTSKFPYRDANDEVAGVIGVARDITEIKKTENALRRSEERLALVTEGSRDGFWDWHLEDRTIHGTARFEGQLGLAPGQLGTDPERWLSQIHPADLGRLRQAVGDIQEGRTSQLHEEMRLKQQDGAHRWMLLRGQAAVDSRGRPIRLAGSQTDITDERLYDPVTGLPNRRLFLERAREAVKRRASDSSRHCAIMAVLIEGLESLQALDGAAGDQVLEVLGARVRSCGPDDDEVARVGPTELAVLIRGTRSTDETMRLGERIRDRIAEPVRLADGTEVLARARVGVVISRDRCLPDHMLRNARTAALGASRQGGCELFDTAMHDGAVRRIELTAALRRSLDTPDLHLHYQPIVSLVDGRLLGFEALARWRRQGGENVSPVEFISLAEDSGLIVPLGVKLLREACLAIRRWRDLPGCEGLTVAVNLAAEQILAPGITADVSAALEASGLPPAALELEVTETSVLRDIEAAVRALETLRAMGVGLSLDDFGTGYSSLAYLHRIPATKLKVDRSFVSRLGQEAQSLNVVRAIMAVATGMGLDVVAEGIETEAQRRVLHQLGCSLGQGYWFSRPLPVLLVDDLLRHSMSTDGPARIAGGAPTANPGTPRAQTDG